MIMMMIRMMMMMMIMMMMMMIIMRTLPTMWALVKMQELRSTSPLGHTSSHCNDDDDVVVGSQCKS